MRMHLGGATITVTESESGGCVLMLSSPDGCADFSVHLSADERAKVSAALNQGAQKPTTNNAMSAIAAARKMVVSHFGETDTCVQRFDQIIAELPQRHHG